MKALKDRWLFTLVVLAMLGAGLAVYAANWMFVGVFIRGSDGQLYYAQARSLVIDGDMDYENEMTELTPSPELFRNGIPRAKRSGRVANRYAFGWAATTLPMFAAVHGVTRLAGGPATGYSLPYELTFPLWHLGLCVASLTWLAWTVRAKLGAPAAAAGLAAVFLGTNVLYYATAMAIMSQVVSCTMAAVVLACGWRLHERPGSRRLWLAAAAGLYMLVLSRPTNAMLGAALLPAAWRLYRGERGPSAEADAPAVAAPSQPLAALAALGLAGLAVVFATLTQIVVWRAGLGYWSLNPYAEHGETMDLLSPAIPQIFFSTEAGAWYFHPVFALGMLGVVTGAVRRIGPGRWFWLALLLGWGLHIYVHACWFDWTFGHAFGHRLFVDSSPYALAGVAALWQAFIPRVRPALAGLLALLIGWNLLLTLAKVMFILPPDGPVPPGDLIQSQLAVIQEVMKRLPF